MKKLTLLLSVLLAMFLCMASYASYISYLPQQITQPNGNVINCFASGDEKQSYLHDDKGFTIIKDPSTGYYVYAAQDGNNIRPTGLIVGLFSPSSAGLKPKVHKKVTPEEMQESIIKSINSNNKGSAQATSGAAYSLGKVNPVVIFVNFYDPYYGDKYPDFINHVLPSAFTDVPVTAYAQTRFNGEKGYPASIKSYFEEASYGKFTLNFKFPQEMSSIDKFVIYPLPNELEDNKTAYRNYWGWYLPLPSAEPYFGYQNDNDIPAANIVGHSRFDYMIRAAINQFNYSPYTISGVNTTFRVPSPEEMDVDGDGFIDNIIIVVAGPPYGAYPGGYDHIMWNRSGQLPEGAASIKGVKAKNYNLIFADTLLAPSAESYDEPYDTTLNTSIVAHEVLHNIGKEGIGVPDYDFVLGGDFLTLVNPWDIMGNDTYYNTFTDPANANTPSISAYTKWKYLGWIDDIPVIKNNNDHPKTYYVNPITAQDNQAYKIIAPNSPLGEYFIVEYRDLKGRYESKLPNEGLIIYRVKEPTNYMGMIIPSIPYELYAFRPGGTLSNPGSVIDAPFGIAPGRDIFDIDTDPASLVASTEHGDSVFSGVKIKNIQKYHYPDLSYMMAFDLEFQIFLDYLKFKEDSLTLIEGQNFDFGDSDFIDFSPKNADIKYFQWTSSDPTVATVDKDGYARALKAGTTVITVSSYDHNVNVVKSECTLTVVPQIPTEEIILNPSGTIEMWIGEEVSIDATILPENTTYKDVSWESTDSNIAKVKVSNEKSAVIEGVSEGECDILVKNIYTSKTVLSHIIVHEPDITDLILTPNSATIEIGKTVDIDAEILPDTIVDKTITWTSGNTGIATVNSDGVVTGISAGTVTITARTSTGFSSAATITVVNSDVTKIEITPSEKTIRVLETFYVTAKITPVTASQAVTWSSSNESVAKVDSNGKVSAYKAGTADIIGTAANGLTAKCKLTVNYTDTISVTVNPTQKELKVGGGFKITSTVNPSTADQTVIWTSFDPAVASVDENGNVTALKVGNTNVTATTIYGSKSATCQVTVKSQYAVPVTGVTLAPTSVTLKKGEDYKLKATVLPANADNKDLIWESLNPAVCTVDGYGNIKAIAVGGTLIRVTTVDGAKTALCMVAVRK